MRAFLPHEYCRPIQRRCEPPIFIAQMSGSAFRHALPSR